MSKKNNVNPDHYKTAGRERQGEDIVHNVYKRRYAESRSAADANVQNFIRGDRDVEYIYKLQFATEARRRSAETHRKGGGK